MTTAATTNKATGTAARWAWAYLAWTVVVVLSGAFVRATGSGAGCGDHWPLCNGAVVPLDPRVETVIEYSHRLLTGLMTPLLVIVSALTWRATRAGRPGTPARGARWLLLPVWVFLLTEAAVGAGLVKLGLVVDDASTARAVVMGFHLANTFLLLGATAWLAWRLSDLAATGGRPLGWQSGGAWLVGLLGAALVALLGVGITGAMVALGDTLFPAASHAEGIAQMQAHDVHITVKLRLLHPVLAIGVGALIAGIAARLRARYPGHTGVDRAAFWTISAYATQLIAGFVNYWLLVPVWMQLVHLLLADVLWIAAILLALEALAAEGASRRGAAGVG
jgi:cytochrome c oxidase assembly protein subunit 15